MSMQRMRQVPHAKGLVEENEMGDLYNPLQEHEALNAIFTAV